MTALRAIYRGPIVRPLEELSVPSSFGPNCPANAPLCGPWSIVSREVLQLPGSGVYVPLSSWAQALWQYGKPSGPGGIPQGAYDALLTLGPPSQWWWSSVHAGAVLYAVAAPDWNWLQPLGGLWTWGPSINRTFFFQAPTNQ